MINIDSIQQILAQEGGDLIEFLVIILIMAMSAIGSLIKSKTKDGKARKKGPIPGQPTRPRPSTPSKAPPQAPPAGRKSPYDREEADPTRPARTGTGRGIDPYRFPSARREPVQDDRAERVRPGSVSTQPVPVGPQRDPQPTPPIPVGQDEEAFTEPQPEKTQVKPAQPMATPSRETVIEELDSGESILAGESGLGLRSTPRRGKPKPDVGVATGLSLSELSLDELQRAIVLSEVLGQPRALRGLEQSGVR